MLCYVILYYIILYYVILHVVLYCTILILPFTQSTHPPKTPPRHPRRWARRRGTWRLRKKHSNSASPSQHQPWAASAPEGEVADCRPGRRGRRRGQGQLRPRAETRQKMSTLSPHFLPGESVVNMS